MSAPIYGAVEAGGTKFICAVGDALAELEPPTRIETTSPLETLAQVTTFFQQMQARHGRLQAIGIASFGPAELDRASADWGHILTTPKPGWSHVDIAGHFARGFDVPIGFETDVNAAALAEHRFGAARDARLAVYVTVGTGIGGGMVHDGRIVHGASHPEMGHVILRRHPQDREFAGICPFHGDCLEGLASGPAIKARWGKSLSGLGPDHPAHDIIAWYIGQFVSTLQFVLAPTRIVFGGGVMDTPGLLDGVRRHTAEICAGYALADGRENDLVRSPGLPGRSGLTGAFLLAQGAALAHPGIGD
jgi:fructokinase